MPAGSSPICSRAPASTVSRRETDCNEFKGLRACRARDAQATKQMKQWTTSRGKTHWLNRDHRFLADHLCEPPNHLQRPGRDAPLRVALRLGGVKLSPTSS